MVGIKKLIMKNLFKLNLFTYDKDSLTFRPAKQSLVIMVLVFCLASIFSYSYGRLKKFDKLSSYEEQLLILSLGEKNKFTEELFVQLLKDLNVRYPHIAMAQSIVETGHFKSRIFRENNNLFGMKESVRRVSTAKGTQHNHAYYDNWGESVYDYAFYQCRYLGSLKSEGEYYQCLSSYYAEDPNYVIKVKNAVEKYNLESKF